MGDTFLPHLASQSTRCALVCSKCLPLRPDCSMLPLWRLGFTCSTSLCRRLESSRFFTASLFFAGRSCLCFSRRVASLQVGLSQALSSSSRRISSSLQHPSPTQIRTVHQQIRPSRWIHIFFNWQHICDPRFFFLMLSRVSETGIDTNAAVTCCMEVCFHDALAVCSSSGRQRL